MTLPMETCKKRLALLWFIGAGLLFLLLFGQTLFGRYGDRANDAWSWLLPGIMPTLSLMISVFAADVLGKGFGARQADRFVFRLCFSLSLAYLAVLHMMILLSPFSAKPALSLMQESNLWLGPFQGLVTASIGIFFIKQEKS